MIFDRMKSILWCDCSLFLLFLSGSHCLPLGLLHLGSTLLLVVILVQLLLEVLDHGLKIPLRSLPLLAEALEQRYSDLLFKLHVTQEMTQGVELF